MINSDNSAEPSDRQQPQQEQEQLLSQFIHGPADCHQQKKLYVPFEDENSADVDPDSYNLLAGV